MTEVNTYFVQHSCDEHNYIAGRLFWMVVGKTPKEFCQNVDSPPAVKMMKGILQPGIHDIGNMFQDFTSLQISKSVFFTDG